MPTVTPTNAFLRDLKRLGSAIRKKAAADALVLFAKNAGHSKLNFEHVLSRKGYHTIRANKGDRILLSKEGEGDAYRAVAIGDHDYIYKGFFKNR
jgi:hypothetical protein